jgi:hypothetical protein
VDGVVAPVSAVVVPDVVVGVGKWGGHSLTGAGRRIIAIRSEGSIYYLRAVKRDGREMKEASDHQRETDVFLF